MTEDVIALAKVLRKDSRYPVEAYLFVREALSTPRTNWNSTVVSNRPRLVFRKPNRFRPSGTSLASSCATGFGNMLWLNSG